MIFFNRMEVSPGNTIKLTFSDFDTETFYDTLTVMIIIIIIIIILKSGLLAVADRLGHLNSITE